VGNKQWDIPKLRELLEDILPKKRSFDNYEIEHNFETIGRKTMLLNARRIDHVQFILLTIEDITERKETEEQMREMFMAIDTSLSAVALANKEGNIKYANPVYLKIHGFNDASEVIGTSFTLRAENIDSIVEEMHDKGGFIGKFTAVRKDNSKFDADGLKISQVVINLISNAFKFTPDGGTILFEAVRTTDNEMMISITDNGKGIREELQKKLFNPFERLQSQKAGTGLGLALSKRIVQLWNGKIGVVSSPEGRKTGCRFYFTIPFKISVEE